MGRRTIKVIRPDIEKCFEAWRYYSESDNYWDPDMMFTVLCDGAYGEKYELRERQKDDLTHIVTLIHPRYKAKAVALAKSCSLEGMDNPRGYIAVRWCLNGDLSLRPEERSALLCWLKEGRTMRITYFHPCAGYYPVPQEIRLIEDGSPPDNIAIGRRYSAKGLGI